MSAKTISSFLFIFLFFLIPDGSAIERITVVGAREAALSMAVISIPGSFSVFHNQAFLAVDNTKIDFIRIRSAGVSLRQPYFLTGYSESALSIVIPAHDIVFGLGLTHTGIANYSESSVGLAIAKRLTRKLSAGLFFNYFTFSLPESGQNKGSFQLDGGFAYQYSEILSFGFHLRNAISSAVSTFQYNVAFPLLLRGGASCRLTERILLCTETSLETESGFEKKPGLDFRFGMEYSIRENFFFRGGISTKLFQHSAGFGYKWNACQVDFALVHHEILGYSPIFSLSYNFTHLSK